MIIDNKFVMLFWDKLFSVSTDVSFLSRRKEYRSEWIGIAFLEKKKLWIEVNV